MNIFDWLISLPSIIWAGSMGIISAQFNGHPKRDAAKVSNILSKVDI